MTGEGTIATAVEAMKAGEFDYILKPFKLSAVLPVLARAAAIRRLRREKAALEHRLRERNAEPTHVAKNNTNAYFLPKSDGEVTALEQRDTKAAVNAFGELQKAFHRDSNTLKNASLYVDFDGTFKAPSAVTARFTIDWSKWEPEFEDYYGFFTAVTKLADSQDINDLFAATNFEGAGLLWLLVA